MTDDRDVELRPGEGPAWPPVDEARRDAIAAALLRLGFLSDETAHRENAAVVILATLLPNDADLSICLSCHSFEADGPYRFTERSGVFRRPTTPRSTATYTYGAAPDPVPMRRTEIVMCSQDELLWTRSEPRVHRGAVTQDTVTLCSVPFTEILGASVRKRHKGLLDVWIDDGPTLSFQTTPREVDTLCSHIEATATE